MPALPRIGQGVRLLGPNLPGTGEVVCIASKGKPLSQEAVMRFYGINPDTDLEGYNRAAAAYKCDRIIIRRDDPPHRHVILPTELFYERFVQVIQSPECPGCGYLVPFQKWAGGVCPHCSAPHIPEAAVDFSGEEK